MSLDQTLKTLQGKWNLLNRGITDEFLHEFRTQMQSGLNQSRSGSIAMIPTFIRKTKTFKPGFYMGLDLSGTNFRVVLMTLNQDQQKLDKPYVQAFRIPSELKAGSNGKVACKADLFDFLAKHIRSVLKEQNLLNESIHVGFTFAFPTRMRSTASGTLIKWTKDWDVPDLVGQDPAEALRESLARAGLGRLVVNALVNDTVGTLVVGYFENRSSLIGGILGTGTNLAAWVKDEAHNFESGNYNLGSLQTTLMTDVDRELDRKSQNPGHQIFEKMVSGRYVGALYQSLLTNVLANSPVEQTRVSCEDLSQVIEDMGALEFTGKLLRTLKLSDETDARKFAQKIAALVTRRSAQLSALAVASAVGFLERDLKTDVQVAIDGSLFEHVPNYQLEMREMLNQCLGSKAERIHLKLAKDGSGLGAALVSSVVASQT